MVSKTHYRTIGEVMQQLNTLAESMDAEVFINPNDDDDLLLIILHGSPGDGQYLGIDTYISKCLAYPPEVWSQYMVGLPMMLHGMKAGLEFVRNHGLPESPKTENDYPWRKTDVLSD